MRLMPLLARMLAAPLVIDVRPGAVATLGSLLADRRIALEEVRMLDALRRLLEIDKLTAAAIERGARAKYQVA